MRRIRGGIILACVVAAVAAITAPVVSGVRLTSDLGAIGGSNRLPNGWALAPVGQQINTERATTGVTVSPDGQGVYGVTSGIFDEAVESINANTLVATPTLVSSAFQGVASDAGGDVWVSSGPQNEVFQYLAGAPGAPLVDARQAGPAPQEPNRGIPVIGYPGNMLLDNPSNPQHLFVAGTLSVPGFGNAVSTPVKAPDGNTVTCPSSDNYTPNANNDTICGVVNVLDVSEHLPNGTTNPSVTPTDHVIGVGRDAYAMAYSPSGTPGSGTLYVSNWADQTNPGRTGAGKLQSAEGTVSVVSVNTDGTGAETMHVEVGNAPTGLALSPDRSLLVVANSGGDTLSAIPVDPATGAPVDPTTHLALTPDANGLVVDPYEHTVWVGIGPQGAHLGAQPMAVSFSPDGQYVLVALAGLNAVEVLQSAGSDVSPIAQSAAGSPATYIATGWWPDALAVGSEPKLSPGNGYRLYVANLKGQGAGPGYYGQLQPTVGTGTEGTISAIDVPSDPGALQRSFSRWTADVVRNDQLAPVFDTELGDPAQNACSGVAVPGDAAPVDSTLLCQVSHGNTVITNTGATINPKTTHVVFILAENKTFDSYFGDTAATLHDNGSPSFNEYPLPVTTNQHALAGQFTLSDDFWNEGAEASTVGHSWWASAITTPDRELTWGQAYDQGLRGGRTGGQYAPGSTANVGSVSLSGPSDPAVAAEQNLMQNPYTTLADAVGAPDTGLTTRVYGTDVSPLQGSPSQQSQVNQGAWGEGPASGGDPTPGSDLGFPDSDRADIFLHGQTPVSHAWDATEGAPPASFGKPFPATPLTSASASQGGYTLDGWTTAYDDCMKANTDAQCQSSMPNFIYMSLPENHTYDVSNVFNPLNPTPASMVADNDYAIGKVIDGLSHSPFWKNTVVFLSEDDNQFTGDHVDIHRTFLLTMGGLAARHGSTGHVSHQLGSFPSALKTAEILLGLPPLTLFDWRAAPLQDVIANSDRANAAPYNAVVPPTPFLGEGPVASQVGSAVPPPAGPVKPPDPAQQLSMLPYG